MKQFVAIIRFDHSIVRMSLHDSRARTLYCTVRCHIIFSSFSENENIKSVKLTPLRITDRENSELFSDVKNYGHSCYTVLASAYNA